MPTPGFEDEPTHPFAEHVLPRVLLAEDDPELRSLVAARLRRGGCDVLEVSTGHQALDLLVPTFDPGVVRDELRLAIMDVRMPGMSGLEVVYLLRQWRTRTPILLITAFPEPELFEEASRLGVNILAKPFGIERLHAEATAVMRRSAGAA